MGTSTNIMSNYLENKILQHILLGTPYTMPQDVWLGLHFNLLGAGDGDTGNERTGFITRDRQKITCISGLEIIDYTIKNIATISFDEAVSDWGTLYGWGFYDASVSGNLLFWGELDTPVANPIGQIFRIIAGNLTMIFSQPNIAPPMGGWTTFSSLAMANWLVNGISLDSTLTGVYIALGREVIQNNQTDHLFDSWIEISASDYSRIHMVLADWETYHYDGTISNLYEIPFVNSAIQNWGIISDYVFYDSGNNPILWGHLNDPVTVNTGDGFKFLSNSLSISFN